MTYELFLTTFDRAETAAEVSARLRERAGEDDVQVLEVVVLARRADGSADIHELGDLGLQHDKIVGAIAGRLLGALLGKPAGLAAEVALGSAGAAIGAAGDRLTGAGLYPDSLKEFAQALAPGTSTLLAILAPEHAATYAQHIADFGGETMRFPMSNDAGREFQGAKQAFIARQAERRREQLAAWNSTSAERTAELEAMNHELAQLYAAMSDTSSWQQMDLRVQAASQRMRRDAARALLNKMLAAEVQRLDEEIARYQEAITRATSEETRAALVAQNETLHRRRVAAEQELAASQDAELQERWRDLTALQSLVARADPQTRITLTMQLAELRVLYGAAREARSTTMTRAAMSDEPARHTVTLGAQVQCADGYGGCVISLIVDPRARRLTHLVVQDFAFPPVERLVPVARVAATTRDQMTLDCTRETLVAHEPFIEEDYIRSSAPDYQPIYALSSFAEFQAKYIPVVTERIPPGELEIQWGAQVVAGDKEIGEVRAFVVEAASGAISAVLVRQGEWPIRHERAIPIAAVERIGSHRFYLK